MDPWFDAKLWLHLHRIYQVFRANLLVMMMAPRLQVFRILFFCTKYLAGLLSKDMSLYDGHNLTITLVMARNTQGDANYYNYYFYYK